MKVQWIHSISWAKIHLVEEDGFLTFVDFYDGQPIDETIRLHKSELIERAIGQLKEYFERKRTNFELPLKPKGSAFEQKVWQALLSIPYGETRCYEEIAIQIGNDKAVRAVGGANHRNPIGIIIPCHRVIGKNKKLVGYAGGLEKKQQLLDLEKGLLV